MVLVDGAGTPLGVRLDSASPAEVKLVGLTLKTVRVGHLGLDRPRSRPEHLIAGATIEATADCGANQCRAPKLPSARGVL